MLKSWQETLEYAFDVLNKVYFNNELPPIVITIMSSPRSNGHFTLAPEWRVGEESSYMHEINISAEHLDRPIESVMSTLLHEMVHWHNFIHGIKDCSQGGRYHNRNFKIECEKRNLKISQAKYVGWSVTTPTPEFIQVLKEHGIEKPVDMNRDGYFISQIMGILGKGGIDGVDGIELPKKPKCSTRKYMCRGCGNSFRATKDINVLCLDCMVEFEKVEK